MSSERRGAELLLDSMGAFRSSLLRVMVAVGRRWLQRVVGGELGNERVEARRCGGVGVGEPQVLTVDEMGIEGLRTAAKAEENDMKTNELQTILGYLNIGLAIAHNTGVQVGHFGSTDFIQLAQMVNGLLLNAITPAANAVPAAGVAAGAPIVINAPASASVAVAG